jgi:NADH-quinone oxidoreductase subunit H
MTPLVAALLPGWLESIRQSTGDPLFFWVLSPLVKIAVVMFILVLPLVTAMIIIERKVLGFIQFRTGPNRVGPWGLLQPIADVAKLLTKEDIIPREAVRWAFLIAPCLVVVPMFVIFSVIPFGPPGQGDALDFFITDVNVAALFIIATATLGVYGIIIAGWASNSKFSLMGGLRSAAQMVSYEVPQGLSVVGPLMLAGSMSLIDIVEAQRQAQVWYVFPQFLAFFVYLVAGVAETNRNPFDLPEAESELVAGFHTEYTGMRFALFFLGEYGNMVVISAVASILFLGGWLRPFPNQEWSAFLDGAWLPFGLAAVVPLLWMFIKVMVFMLAYVWFRGTFPRYRFDQLMALGWKWMLPLALVNVVITGVMKLALSGGFKLAP